MPITTTNYRVERTLKGALPSVVQLNEEGARQDGSFPCSNWAYEIANVPLTQLGHRYVLFLLADLGGGRYKAGFGSAAQLEIVDGLVYSRKHLDSRADFSINFKPEPLAVFVKRFG